MALDPMAQGSASSSLGFKSSAQSLVSEVPGLRQSLLFGV